MTGANHDPRPPALTRAEQDFVEHYLRAIDVLGRMNPAQNGDSPITRGANAAQALEAAARGIRSALEQMVGRGEDTLFSQALTQAMVFSDGERRLRRLRLHRTTPDDA